ncbi:MAG: hypothetical protein ACYDA3_14830 [Gaiellaceae bacterium]
MSTHPDVSVQLRDAIKNLSLGDERPPLDVGSHWDDAVRWTLDGWVAALERDLRRAENALAVSSESVDTAPTDDQVAALEECLWRIASATDKVDAIVALAFSGQPFMVVADDPTQITMRPSRDRNTLR